MDRPRAKDQEQGAAKIGRNVDCPCGSGRKYKHCCGISRGDRPEADAPRVQGPGAAANQSTAVPNVLALNRSPNDVGQFLQALSAVHVARVAPQSASGADPSAAGAARAHLARAHRYAASGNLSAAITAARQAAEADPSNAVALLDYGTLCLRGSLFDDAVQALHRATILAPDSAKAWFHLGVALGRASNERAAITAYQRAVALAPGMSEALSLLGSSLMAVGRYAEAREVLTRLAAGRDKRIGRLSQTQLFFLDERFAEAETTVRQLIARNPSDAEALHWLGDILLSLGRIAEAAATYEQAMKADPNKSALYYSLVQSRRIGDADRALVVQMERRVAAGRVPEVELMFLHFALGKAYDDLNESESAMRHFDAANLIRGRFSTFDRVRWEQRIERTIERFSPSLLAEFGGLGVSDATPILIVGMPRSGTTLMEQIVSSHPMAAARGELLFWSDNDALALHPEQLTATTAQQLASAYLAVLHAGSTNRPRVTDKMPFNYLYAGLVHLVFPNARIIHCRRSPVDTCLSIYSNYFTTKMQFASDRHNLVFYFRQYERLMAHWRRVLPAERFIEIDYETLVGERETTTRRILEFLDLPWDEACLAPERNTVRVKTASMWQVRQPVYSSSVARWRRYEPWLGELRQLLGPTEAAATEA